jgi:phosphomannomutase/phosphoglucomutase
LVAAFPGLRLQAGGGGLPATVTNVAVAPEVLRRLGQEVVELFCTPDGTFPNRDPNPAVPEHLSALCQAVHDHGADLGVAYDGDGDRAIFVDERGRVIPADRAFVLLVRHLVPTESGAGVVYDLKSSVAVPEAIATAGGRPLMERSGHAFTQATHGPAQAPCWPARSAATISF